MKEFFTNHIDSILAYLFGAGGFFSAWTEQKKRKQELLEAENYNQQQVMSIYQEALDDLKKRYDEKFGDLDFEIKSLKESLNLWKGKYRALKKEFDEYRTKHEN